MFKKWLFRYRVILTGKWITVEVNDYDEAAELRSVIWYCRSTYDQVTGIQEA